MSIEQQINAIAESEKQRIFDYWEAFWTRPIDKNATQECIDRMWHHYGKGSPKISYAPSPKACAMQKIPNSSRYFSYWTVAYAMFYDLCKQHSIVIPDLKDDDRDFFLKFAENVGFIYFNDEVVWSSEKPTIISRNDQYQLHNENGPALAYADDVSLWFINGVELDKQIVMDPTSQDLNQIISDPNQERKRIRINRYGVDKFLSAINAKVVHSSVNDIEGTKEHLIEVPKLGMKYLLCVCPSTAKEFFLEAPEQTTTTKEVQQWLSCGLSNRIISAS